VNSAGVKPPILMVGVVGQLLAEFGEFLLDAALRFQY
jgi:hypothetical protein